jgi:hypothetical protein
MITAWAIEFLKKYYVWVWAIVSTTLSAYLLTRPAPKPIVTTRVEFKDRIVTQQVDKVVYRDVVKYKDIVRTKTITKPGGVTIVDKTETKSGESDQSKAMEEAKSTEHEVTKQTTVQVSSPNPKFLLSVSANPYTGLYSGSAAVRPFSALPVYVGGGIIKVDTSYKPVLTLGVTF